MVTDADTPTADHWKDLIPEDRFPLSVSTCGGKIYAQYLRDAVSYVVQYGLDGSRQKGNCITWPGHCRASAERRRSGNCIMFHVLMYTRPRYLNMILPVQNLLSLKAGGSV